MCCLVIWVYGVAVFSAYVTIYLLALYVCLFYSWDLNLCLVAYLVLKMAENTRFRYILHLLGNVFFSDSKSSVLSVVWDQHWGMMSVKP